MNRLIGNISNKQVAFYKYILERNTSSLIKSIIQEFVNFCTIFVNLV